MFQKAFKILLVVACLLCAAGNVQAQRFLSEYDSTLFVKDTLLDVATRLKNLHFSGYIQPQYQVASQQGIESYSGGMTSPTLKPVSNRTPPRSSAPIPSSPALSSISLSSSRM